MDLALGTTYETVRKEIREFLAEHWPNDNEGSFRQAAIARGYLGRSVPVAFGGSEQKVDPRMARVISEEFGRAGAPTDTGIGMTMLVPTLLERGADWQKRQFIPPTVRGELRWCQGYSEPGAGSDLPSLVTRAELDGDEWIVNGQKVWTTQAHTADMMFVLARTEPGVAGRKGISYLLLDMRQPGVEVRPLKQLTGTAEFNEVFFTDARTPKDWLVGERGEGWSVANSTLKHERAGVGDVSRTEGMFRNLVKLAQRRTLNGRPAIEDPAVQERLVEIEGYLEAHRYAGYHQFSKAVKGESAAPWSFMSKLSSTNIGHQIGLLALDLLEEASLRSPLGHGGDGRPGDERWLLQYLGSLGLSLGGGTSNIQRNIIAERGFGFPRDPYPRVPASDREGS
jgi:alkylation response protein AidB-like acyl-CoA dehydrogenase